MNYINKQTQSNLQNFWVHITLFKSKLTLEINNTQTKSQLTTVNKLKLKLKLKKKTKLNKSQNALQISNALNLSCCSGLAISIIFFPKQRAMRRIIELSKTTLPHLSLLIIQNKSTPKRDPKSKSSQLKCQKPKSYLTGK